MLKLWIELDNCYWIWSLNHEFEFSDKKCQLIYAQNGTMKSSFAKTFDQLSKWNEPEELIYWRTVKYKIAIDGSTLDKDTLKKIVYVAHSEPNYFESNKISTLLVDDVNKKKYETEILKINTELSVFINFLKWKSSIRWDEKLISQFTTDFVWKPINDLLPLLEWITIEDSWYQNIDYWIISKAKVETFLKVKGMSVLLQEYIETYEELLSKSKYFSKWVFNHNNGENIYKNLWDNNFFQADHKVRLKWEKDEISTPEELQKRMEEDKNTVLTDPALEKKFRLIDDKLKWNNELRNFRSYIEDNREIIPEFSDYSTFKKKIWISYIFEWYDIYDSLMKTYMDSKTVISKVVEEAKEQETQWHSIVEEFSKRFNPNFSLRIENQDDIILKGEQSPQIVFEYDDKNWLPPKRISSEILKRVLSTWERRTLFILNILFELHARKEDGNNHLIIFDDIADSFDYGNKYSIVEYLKELSEDNNNLYFIILTHNFDFFRTLQYRFFGERYRKQSYMVNKLDDCKIELLEAAYLNPFWYFRNNFHKKKDFFIATIPFVRNLIEYSDWMNAEYLNLTCCLHRKHDSNSLTVNCIFDILNDKLWWSKILDSCFSPTDNILDFMEKVADEIYLTNPTWINLQNKIVFAVIIRLYGEKIMISEIELIDPNIKTTLESETNQTRFLFDEYKRYGLLSWEKWNCIKKVVMLTPENIHINSFMYEPILDTSEHELRELFNNLKIYL